MTSDRRDGADPWLLYFAYGSNMSRRRLTARVPSARPVAGARLWRYRLAFHKVGRDGSGKCDIVPCVESMVHGVLFEIASRDKPSLDACEDLGRGYAEGQVSVTTDRGQTVRAFTYVALLRDTSLQPFDWYLRHLIEGAVEHRLPVAYRDTLAAIETDEDPDRERALRELALYAGSIT